MNVGILEGLTPDPSPAVASGYLAAPGPGAAFRLVPNPGTSAFPYPAANTIHYSAFTMPFVVTPDDRVSMNVGVWSATGGNTNFRLAIADSSGKWTRPGRWITTFGNQEKTIISSSDNGKLRGFPLDVTLRPNVLYWLAFVANTGSVQHLGTERTTGGGTVQPSGIPSNDLSVLTESWTYGPWPAAPKAALTVTENYPPLTPFLQFSD